MYKNQRPSRFFVGRFVFVALAAAGALTFTGAAITVTANWGIGYGFSAAVGPSDAEVSLNTQPVTTFTMINTNDSGPGSLRQAMLDANATANSGGPDVINFAIPGLQYRGAGIKTIVPSSALPTITSPVVIDVTVIDGTNNSTAAGTENDFFQNSSMNVSTNHSLGHVPTNLEDVLLTTRNSALANAAAVPASFAPKQDFVTGVGPISVAVGDLNGDGKPDVVVANSRSTLFGVSVLLNTTTPGGATPTFAAKQDFATDSTGCPTIMTDLNSRFKIEISKGMQERAGKGRNGEEGEWRIYNLIRGRRGCCRRV